jgi:hypothetical protein
MFATVALLTVLAASALVCVGVAQALRIAPRPRLVLAIALLTGYSGVCVWQPGAWWFADAALLLAAAAGGLLIGRFLGSTGAVVAFCVTIAVVDLFSFGGGLTRHIMESYREGESRLLLYLTVSVPYGGAVRPIAGVGDLLILASLFSALVRLGHSKLRAFLVPTAGLTAALLVGLVRGGVAALPFVAVVTILYVLWSKAPQPPMIASAAERLGRST